MAGDEIIGRICTVIAGGRIGVFRRSGLRKTLDPFKESVLSGGRQVRQCSGRVTLGVRHRDII